MAPWMDVLKDPEGTLTPNDVQCDRFQRMFTPVTSNSLNFGLTASTYWLRFQLGIAPGDRSQRTDPLIFDPGIAFPNRVAWSLYESPMGKRVASGGTVMAVDRFARVALPDPAQLYYLRVQSDTGLILQPRLYSLSSYLKRNRLVAIGLGIFYGILISAAAYNLFLFFSFNEYSYLWYVLHLVFIMLYFLGVNGLTAYLFPRQPAFVGVLDRSMLGLVIAFVALLTRSFLKGRLNSPTIDRTILIFFGIGCSLAVFNPIMPARVVNTLLIIMGLVVPSTMALTAWKALKCGFQPARLVIAAWGVLFAGVITFALITGGMLPYTELGFHSFQGGAAITAILLSVALGDRIQGLVRDITQRKAMEDTLKRMASTDPLTGADNRRSFLEKGAYELMRSRRYGHPFALLMMDVDHFKMVNDTYGHHKGDEVLKALVSRSHELLRDTDLFGRMGGEEFAVILPQADVETAMEIAERMRQELSRVRIPSAGGTIRFTVSIGVTAVEEEDETLEKILQRADSALYQAKASGRNCLFRM